MPLGDRFDTNDFMNQRDSLAQSYVLSGLVRDQGEVCPIALCVCKTKLTNKMDPPLPADEVFASGNMFVINNNPTWIYRRFFLYDDLPQYVILLFLFCFHGLANH